jgi:hypothetical protein
MEMSQYSLYKYLKKTKISLCKTENRKVNQVFLGLGTSGRRKDIMKACRRLNVVEMLCTHMKTEKLDLLKLFQEREERDKENDGR